MIQATQISNSTNPKDISMNYIIEKYGSIEKYIDSTGVIGSAERLQTISNLDLGQRSLSAKKVLQKRNYRKDLMKKGLSISDAVLIVNRNNEG